MHLRQQYMAHIAQTSPAPLAIHMVKAEGVYQYDETGKRYIDMISGFSVSNIGHGNPKVVQAVKDQAEKYMHLIVYGEYIETPQVEYAKLLVDNLPSSLNSVYFTNSGTEATEGAMKLAKRATGGTKIFSFRNAYHGSSQGALSIMGGEYWKNAFRPLLPETYLFDYNQPEIIKAIDKNTACVIMEVVQAEGGVVKADKEWLQKIRKKCDETGTLLIYDEIQSGFGRTGSLWAFEQYGVVPDVLMLGKALGGGMPLGAFIADKKLMDLLTHNPVLGHITTFGGHPVSCAAGKAALEVLLDGNYIDLVKEKEAILHEYLVHPKIKSIRTAGLWGALEFANNEEAQKVVEVSIENGVLSDFFLFAPNYVHVGPPLTITNEELILACELIVEAIGKVL
ncbi:MAG: aspartate aminotransferase family protein [Pseudopedobacter saltans]|uniref:Aspartate aminotransferase family protein n=1 Tax=Pseudopedobacter saltans TaxID=151895 RepID=A0A2W5F639_9SPHI|nr:MAG: aspartate aminotransferase family protein [Pseudopedobacter saltans]